LRSQQFIQLFCILFLATFTLLVFAQQTQSMPEASLTANSRIIAPPANYSFSDETFTFTGEWRIWTAGTATFNLSRDGSRQKVSATAESAGVVSLLYPVHDRFQALFDPKTFCSVSVHKHSEEGQHKRETQISFDYTRQKALLDENNLKKNESKHEEHDIPGCVSDVFSGLMYLRSLSLLPGAIYTFPINDGGKTVDVIAKVEARETVKVPAGTFRAIRVSPETTVGPLKSKGKIWIWYTDDAQHIPVQMRGRLFWGTLTFKLQKAERK
jgi:uncharacterized protein DUF3108